MAVKKQVLIFGSTGSIGQNALMVISRAARDFEVLGLCANNDIKTIRFQINEFKPRYVCVADIESARLIEKEIPKNIKFFKGEQGLLDFARIKSDIAVMAITGISCLKPLWESLEHSKRIALANKESIVTAGRLIFARAKKFNSEIIPIDSEINSLFQLFKREQEFNRVHITASGGALLNYKQSQLSKVGAKDVLSHPTWKMGKRITVDCATLVNKAFEVVETHEFFNVPYEKIDVVIHRESTVHAMVECADSTVFSCMYPPDMRTPIAFALHYPKRVRSLNDNTLPKKFTLTFEPMNTKQFPGFCTVIDAAQKGKAALAAINGADEVAVTSFLSGEIKFTAIARVLAQVLGKCRSEKISNIGEVLFWDQWGRALAREYLAKKGLN